MVDQSDSGEKIGNHRQLEHHTQGQDQARNQREIIADLNQGLHPDGFVSSQQKTEAELKHHVVTKRRAEQKEQRAKEDKASGITLFMLIKPRRDKLPSLPKQHGQSDDDRGDKRNFHLGEKCLGHRDADEGQSLDFYASERRGQNGKDLLRNCEATKEGDADGGTRFDQARTKLFQMGGKRHLDIGRLPFTLAGIHLCSVGGSGFGWGFVSEGFSRRGSSLTVASGDESISCSICLNSSFSSSVARRNSAIPLPNARASSGSFLGPRTMSAKTRIKSSSGMPMPNMEVNYSISLWLAS